MGIFTNKDVKAGDEEFKGVYEAMEKRLRKDFTTGFFNGIKTMKSLSDKDAIKYFPNLYKIKENAITNPQNFGFGLGIFFGLIRYKLRLILDDAKILKVIIESMRFLKTIEGFDFKFVTKSLKRAAKQGMEGFTSENIKILRVLIAESQK